MLFLSKIFKDLYIFLKLFFLKRRKNFKILPMGTYCLPRVITTIAKLKPTKKQGEKSLPFDLSFFNDFSKIIKLIDTKFEAFYNNLEYDEHKKCWENKDFSAIFVHDGNLSKEEFIDRYNRRISNLYEYFSDKSFHIYLLIASFDKISIEQLISFRNLMLKYRNDDEFDIILINQSKAEVDGAYKNIHIINQSKNYDDFNKLNKDGKWVRKLKKRNCRISQKIYYEIVNAIIEIIKNY